VLKATGSTGLTIILFVVAGIIVDCITVCWLELARTVPIQYVLQHGIWQKISTIRSGGDKNYVR